MTTRAVVDYNNLAGNKRPCTIAGLAGLGDDLETLNLLRVNENGEILISGTLNQGPVQFDLNGTSIEVAFDESTAANNRPLPTFLVDGISGAAYQGATSANQVIEIALLHGLTGSTSGGATSANQVIMIAELSAATASLSSLNTKAVQESLNFGAAAAGVRTASLIGNVAGIADFGAGTTSAQTIRVVPSTDAVFPLPAGAATSANQVIEIANLEFLTGGMVSATGSLSSLNTKAVQETLDFGAANAGVRVAALLGNTTGVIDFNAGNAGAQTVRTVIATNQGSIPTIPQNCIVTTAYGYVSAGYTSTTDTYIYRATSGSATLQTVTITYIDSTKQNISTIERT